MENENLIRDIVTGIRWLIRKVQYDAFTLNREFGLTGPQGQIMRLLAAYGPLSPVQLSRYLYVTPSNITGIIDRLEGKRLATRIRQTGDRRVTLIALTESGEALCRKLPDVIEEQLIAGLADLSPERVRQLSDSMNQLQELIKAKSTDQAAMDTERNFDDL